MIISVKDVLDVEALNKVIEHRTQLMLADYSPTTSSAKTLIQALDLLRQLRTEEGYMAEFEPLDEGDFSLIEHHCPIYTAAKSCRRFCDSELEVFQKIFIKHASLHKGRTPDHKWQTM